MNKNKNIEKLLMIVKKNQREYRKNMSDEQKQKRRDYQKEYQKNMTDEQKQKQKDYLRKYYKNIMQKKS